MLLHPLRALALLIGASALGCSSSDAAPLQGECNFVGNACAEGCLAAQGSAIDLERRCRSDHRVVFCRAHFEGGLSTMEGCAVDTRTGDVFVMAYGGIITGVPRFRRCTDAESAIAYPAAERTCP